MFKNEGERFEILGYLQGISERTEQLKILKYFI
jgi:hypothetical protein